MLNETTAHMERYKGMHDGLLRASGELGKKLQMSGRYEVEAEALKVENRKLAAELEGSRRGNRRRIWFIAVVLAPLAAGVGWLIRQQVLP